MTTIRAAGPDDAPTILRFIHELAVYEREPDAVEATESGLRDQLAADHPPFGCLLAATTVDDLERDVGMALWFPTYSTWSGTPGIHLEDLYVEPAARGRGVGRALLTALADEVVARGWGRLEWAVLDWNQPAIDFYERVGAAPMDEWTTWRLADDDLHALATPPATR